jgi:hypothetical protein
MLRFSLRSIDGGSEETGMSGPLMEFTSHIEGRNAKVAIYDDRIEWDRSSWRPPGGAGAALLTGGLSLALPGSRRDTNMIPMRQVQGVTTHREGMRFTVVRVATAADAVEFRVGKAQAEEIKATITRLMLAGLGPAPGSAAPAPASVADELIKLAQLRDVGALTEEEFASQKARLLRTTQDNPTGAQATGSIGSV